MAPFVSVFLSIVFGVAGQLMLKQGMITIPASTGGRFLVKIVTSPWVIVGLCVYALGTLFWILALSKLELSYVYPFSSLSYIGIIIGSYVLFKEKITLARLVGIAVIILGLFIVSQT